MYEINIKNLSFSYDEKNVYKDFFAIFPAEEISMLSTPSGSGKTTLLYLIAGILRPQNGHIEYPMATPRFSFVFQDDRLIENLSVEKNIKMVNSQLSDMNIIEALQRLGIEEYYKKKVKHLSGGERKRVSIARALLAEYDILLMDEPFNGIDEENKRKVWEYIKEKTEGKTVIIATHDKSISEVDS